MDVSVWGAATDAFVALMEPFRILMLCLGVLFGLLLGIIPGIGGLVGMALLLPFTYTMDTYAAFAMLLGMAAVIGTSDTIPAVLFGVPGTAGAQATVMDGNPMAKRGEAGRALSAAYASSLVGGLVGAGLLALAIPVLRPLMIHIASPELLALSLLGIAMVAALSGSAPLRGLIAAGLGIMLSMIGSDLNTGTQRWTMGSFYLWDGLPLVPLVLGLFALPELADLAIKREAIVSKQNTNIRSGTMQGFRDVIANWWLVLRGGALGSAIGAIPGLGSSVVDWIAYGWALQTTKGAEKTFGKGDVRGVIAPESANNAITAGALVPTIAFAVPGSAMMAILLSVFLVHGLVPGPEMLTRNLDTTYAMVWSIALANILGAGICIAFSSQLAKIALLRHTIILPVIITFVIVGAFQSTRSWGDLYALLAFAVLGWTMKQLKWPRPPLMLGFVLGALIERYMFISLSRYGMDWLSRPLVVIFMAMALLVMVGPFVRHIRALGGPRAIATRFGAPKWHFSDIFYLIIIAAIAMMVMDAFRWPAGARTGPTIVGIGVMALAVVSLLALVLSRGVKERQAEQEEAPVLTHFDTQSDYGDLGWPVIIRRAALFMGYIVAFMAGMAVIGFIPTAAIFVVVFMWFEGKEDWRLIAAMTAGLTIATYMIFDRLLTIPWPPTLAGSVWPALRIIPSV